MGIQRELGQVGPSVVVTEGTPNGVEYPSREKRAVMRTSGVAISSPAVWALIIPPIFGKQEGGYTFVMMTTPHDAPDVGPRRRFTATFAGLAVTGVVTSCRVARHDDEVGLGSHLWPRASLVTATSHLVVSQCGRRSMTRPQCEQHCLGRRVASLFFTVQPVLGRNASGDGCSWARPVTRTRSSDKNPRKELVGRRDRSNALRLWIRPSCRWTVKVSPRDPRFWTITAEERADPRPGRRMNRVTTKVTILW